jgi:radical SAM-linked protein
MYKYSGNFYKKSEMVYISHLDLMTLFRRVFRRSELPCVITKGFTPRVKVSFPKALKLGVESESEEFSFHLEEMVEPSLVMERLNALLPEGIKVTTIGLT